MKSFLTLLFAAIFSFSAYADIGPVNRSANIKYDGTVDASTIENHYINVINNEGATINAGSAVILDVTADDGASVIIDAAASQTPHCIMVAACVDNALCLCQTYGKYSSALFSAAIGAAVAGAPFFISTGTAGYIEKGTVGGLEMPAGVFYDAASATGAVEVFIKLR